MSEKNYNNYNPETISVERENKKDYLFEEFKARDDVALIYFKGGEKGGLNKELKSKMLDKLGQWFEIIEGEEHKLSFEEIATRWREGYLNYPSLNVMEDNPNFIKEFLEKGNECLSKNNKEKFKAWFLEAKKIAGDDIGLLRLEMMIAYFHSGGENILLKLKKGVDRNKIFEDLGLKDINMLENAVGKERANLDWLSEDGFSFQEFVKRIIIGDTTAYKAAPGTLRSLLAQKIKDKEFFPCLDLWENPDDRWALQSKLTDQELVMSNLLNAIHAASSLQELSLEFNLLTAKDKVKFEESFKKWKENEYSDKIFKNKESLKIPEYNLSDGIKKLVEMIRSKMIDSNQPIIIEISGGSASGKTSAVAHAVKEEFGNDAVIVSADDYYRGKTFMNSEAQKGNVYNWDQPEALDLELMKKQLKELKSGQAVDKPIYDMKIGEPSAHEKVEPKKIIILEGAFVLNEDMKNQGDFKVFVDVGMHGRIIRRLLRDIERTGQKQIDILKYFLEIVEPMHDQYIQPTKENADIIIKNEYDPKIEADRSGLHEVQLKFKVDFESDILASAGAEQLSTSSLQIDNYYNPKDRNLMKTEEMLRIREEDGRLMLTYKGPKTEGIDFRQRAKFDIEIDKDIERRLLSLYGDRVKTIKKQRTMYQLNEVVFSFDKVIKVEAAQDKEVGTFIEIRSMGKNFNEEKLKKAIKDLGLKMEDGTRESYFEM